MSERSLIAWPNLPVARRVATAVKAVLRRQSYLSQEQSTARPSVPTSETDRSLIAYCTRPPGLTLRAATADRQWMDDSEGGFANRCLPLRVANQAGWVILNDRNLEIVWTGGNHITDLHIRELGGSNVGERRPEYVSSHFGGGVITWSIPYLFRTPPGYNLYVRGPANYFKDGVHAMDGIVETDWAVARFTMNWKVMRPWHPIKFEKDEPICMIFPQRRHEIETFMPEVKTLSDNPELDREFNIWSDSRQRFNKAVKALGNKPLWQKHYFRGQTPGGRSFADHQIRIHVREFVDRRQA
jgi:Family of unknown function (DUF6065)